MNGISALIKKVSKRSLPLLQVRSQQSTAWKRVSLEPDHVGTLMGISDIVEEVDCLPPYPASDFCANTSLLLKSSS